MHAACPTCGRVLTRTCDLLGPLICPVIRTCPDFRTPDNRTPDFRTPHPDTGSVNSAGVKEWSWLRNGQGQLGVTYDLIRYTTSITMVAIPGLAIQSAMAEPFQPGAAERAQGQSSVIADAIDSMGAILFPYEMTP